MTEEPTSIAISDQDGKVIAHFSRPTENLVMDPENARQIGEAMAKAAYTARYGKAPEGSAISQQMQARLTTRCTHVIRSLQEKGKLPAYIAQAVIDVVLSEVR